MNNTLKQLQEKGEEEFEKVEKQFMSDIKNGRTDGLYVLDTKLFKKLLHQQITLAYNAGKADMLDTVLKEIEEKLSFYKEMMGKAKNTNRLSAWSDFNSKHQALDTLKNKLLDSK